MAEYPDLVGVIEDMEMDNQYGVSGAQQRVDVPEGMPDLVAAVEQMAAPEGRMSNLPQSLGPQEFTLQQEFGAGLAAGTDGAQMTGFALMRMLGTELGSAGLEDFGQRGIDRNIAEIEAFSPTVQSMGEIEDFESFARWAAGGMGQALPSMATAMAGGGIGGIVGKKLLERGIARTIQQTVRDELQDQGMDAAMATLAVKRLGRNPMAIKTARDAMMNARKASRMGFTRGAATGTFLTSSGMMTGEAILAGVDDPFLALAAGTLGGLLETAVIGRLVSTAFPGVDQAVAKNFIKDFAKSTGTQALMEGTQEGLQQGIQLAALAWQDPSFDLLNPENALQVLDAFAIGALVGTVTGAGAKTIGGTIQGARSLRDGARERNFPDDGQGDMPVSSIDPVGPDSYPPDFEPADNTVLEEVQSRINAAMEGRINPALNSMRDKVQKVIDSLKEELPGLRSSMGSVLGSVKGLHNEFVAGQDPVLTDTRRYAAEQIAYIVEEAQQIQDPVQRAKFIDEAILEAEGEFTAVAKELEDRLSVLEQTAGERVQGLGVVDDEFELERDPDWTFGQLVQRETEEGITYWEPSRGDEAKSWKSRKSARGMIERLRKIYPSATDSTFEIIETEDGRYLVQLADDFQREILLEDRIAAEGLEAARVSAAAHQVGRRKVKLSTKTTVDVPTLAHEGRKLGQGDNQTLEQGFSNMVSMLLTRGIITGDDAAKLTKAFKAYYPTEYRGISLKRARDLDRAMQDYEFIEMEVEGRVGITPAGWLIDESKDDLVRNEEGEAIQVPSANTLEGKFIRQKLKEIAKTYNEGREFAEGQEYSGQDIEPDLSGFPTDEVAAARSARDVATAQSPTQEKLPAGVDRKKRRKAQKVRLSNEEKADIDRAQERAGKGKTNLPTREELERALWVENKVMTFGGSLEPGTPDRNTWDEFVAELDEFLEKYNVKENYVRDAIKNGNLRWRHPDSKLSVKTGKKRPPRSRTPTYDKLPKKEPGTSTQTYAGVGSRDTPKEVLAQMTRIARWLATNAGLTLQSGGAQGADRAFEAGAGANKRIFYSKDATDETRTIAKEVHPAPKRLKPRGLDLMARNTNQIFGANLDTPVDFVLVWTPDGAETAAETSIKTGGTGQAIRLADGKGIPVINMNKPGWEGRLRDVLGMAQPEKKVQKPLGISYRTDEIAETTIKVRHKKAKLEQMDSDWLELTKNWTTWQRQAWWISSHDIEDSIAIKQDELGRKLTKDEKIEIVLDFLEHPAPSREAAREHLPSYFKAIAHARESSRLRDELRDYINENEAVLSQSPEAFDNWLLNFPVAKEGTLQRKTRWDTLSKLLSDWHRNVNDKSWRDFQIKRRREYLTKSRFEETKSKRMTPSSKSLKEMIEEEIALLEESDIQAAVDKADALLRKDHRYHPDALWYPKPDMSETLATIAETQPQPKPESMKKRKPARPIHRPVPPAQQQGAPAKWRGKAWLPDHPNRVKMEGAVKDLLDKVLTMLPNAEIRVINATAALHMIVNGHEHAGAAAALLTAGGPAVLPKEGEITYIILPNEMEMKQDSGKFMKPGSELGALVHELGHVLHHETWTEISREEQDKLWDAFKADVKAGWRGTGKFLRWPEAPGDPLGKQRPATLTVYEFQEWMADQFVAWMGNRRNPRNALERFLEKVGALIDEFWAFVNATPERFGMLNETYADFVDTVARRIANHEYDNGRWFQEGSMGRTRAILNDGLIQHKTRGENALDHKVKGIQAPRLTPEQRRAVQARLNQYPTIASHFQKVKDWFNNAYYLLVAPSSSTMKELSARGIKAADKLILAFDRQPHGKRKVMQNYHQAQSMALENFMNKYRHIVQGMTEEQKQELMAEMRMLDDWHNRNRRENEGQTPPRASQKARELRKLLDEGHTYLKKAGLPIGKTPEYFPRTFSREKLIENEDMIIDWLENTAGLTEERARRFYNNIATDDAARAAALAELRRDTLAMQNPKFAAGRSRHNADPFFDQFLDDNLDGVMANYFTAASKRAEFNRRMGSPASPGLKGTDDLNRSQWDPQKKFRAILAEARRQGATQKDLRKMKQYVEANLGQLGRDDLSEGTRRAMAVVLAYQNMRTLLFTVFASLPDVVGPAIRANDNKAAFKTFFKNLKAAGMSDSELAEMARAWGIISSTFNAHVMTEYVDNHYMPPGVRRMNDAFFKWTGLNWWTDFTRKAALAVGIDSIQNEAHKATFGRTQRERDRAKQFLREMGLTPKMVHSWVNRGRPVWGSVGYTEDRPVDRKIAEALQQFVDESIMRPNAAQRPIMASHPALMLVYHLKGYLYAMHSTILKRIAHNYRIADTPAQVAALFIPALAMMLLTALGLELRELVTGNRQTDRMDGWDYTWELAERSGLTGLTQLVWDWDSASARGQSELAGLTGPTIGQIGDLISRPISQTIPKGIPVVSQLPWARDAVREVF